MKKILLILLLLSGCLPAKVEVILNRIKNSNTNQINVTAAYALNGINWNDYVTKTETNGYDSDDTVCDMSTNPSSYEPCLNGGLYRKAEISGVSSCSGAVLSDTEGWFNWVCVASASKITIYSTGLKTGKKLSDLITTTGFKSNKLNAVVGGVTYSSASTAWWTNAVRPLPENSTTQVITLDGVDDDTTGPDEVYTAGTIFIAANNQTTRGYNLNL